MSRFTRTLSETADRLTVPQSVRSRILLEVAADMDDLYKAYMDRGLEGEAAREAVLEHFDLSDEALEDLVRVHNSPIQGVLNGLSGQPGQGWEKTVLTGLVVGVLAALYGLASQGGILGASSAFVWPVMAVTAVAVGLGVVKLTQVVKARTEPVRALRSGVGAILGLAGIELLLGLSGAWVELYRVALRIQVAREETPLLLSRWLEMASATLTITVGMALITALVWFVVAGRVARAERAHTDQLLT